VFDDVSPRFHQEAAGQVPGVVLLLWEFLFGKATDGKEGMRKYLTATRPFLNNGNKIFKGGQVIECFG